MDVTLDSTIIFGKFLVKTMTIHGSLPVPFFLCHNVVGSADMDVVCALNFKEAPYRNSEDAPSVHIDVIKQHH